MNLRVWVKGRLAIVALSLILIASASGTVVYYQFRPQWILSARAQVYEDIRNGFSFRYPAGWALIPEDDLKHRNEKFVAGVYIPESPSTAIGVIREVRDPSQRFESKIFRARLEENLEKNLQELVILSLKEKKQNDAYLYDISYTYNNSGKAFVRQHQKIFVTQDALYYVSGSALRERYPQNEKEIDFILDSFILDRL